MKTEKNSWFRRSELRMTLVLVVTLLIASSVDAQDMCSDILTSGVHDTYQNINKDSEKSQYQQNLCDTSSSLNQNGTSAGGGISIAGIGDANGNYGNTNLSDLRHKYCSGASGSMSNDDFQSLVKVTIDPFIVQNWSECMASEGKGLYGNVDVNSNDLLFTLEWQGFGGVNTATIDKPAQITGATCDSAVLTKGVILQDRVPLTEICHRLGDNAVTLVLNTNRGSKVLRLGPPIKLDLTHSASYVPSEAGIAVPLSATVHRDDLGAEYAYEVSFIVPPAPKPPAVVVPFNLITIYEFQIPPSTPANLWTQRVDLPASTYPSVQGDWKPGDRVTFRVKVPKLLADPSKGWDLVFCVGAVAACYPSPNLLMGSPI
jgi:hypothetical protein